MNKERRRKRETDKRRGIKNNKTFVSFVLGFIFKGEGALIAPI